MNYLRMLAGLLCAILSSIGMCAYGQSVWTLEDIFERAETSSVQLRPSFSAQDEAHKEISVAKNGRLPDINASLSVGYIGNGFTTRRDFSDYQEAPIPHLSTGLSLSQICLTQQTQDLTQSNNLSTLESISSTIITNFYLFQAKYETQN